MISVKPIQVSKEKPGHLYGRYKIGPFPKGNALSALNTLAKSLRSDLSRSCITSIRFHDPQVKHEFTFIPGVRETALEFLINLQNISFVLDYSKLQVNKTVPIQGALMIKGPKRVTATDLKLPTGIKCVDSTQYIATIDSNSILRFDFFINGPTSLTVSIPEVEEITNSSQFLYTTPVFNPVKQVNMCLEDDCIDGIEMESGLFEVWTDGSIHPYAAIRSSLGILTSLFWVLFKSTSKYTESIKTNHNLNDEPYTQIEEKQMALNQLDKKLTKKTQAKIKQRFAQSWLNERKTIKQEKMLDDLLLAQLRSGPIGEIPLEELRKILHERRSQNLELRQSIRKQIVEDEKVETKTLDIIAKKNRKSDPTFNSTKNSIWKTDKKKQQYLRYMLNPLTVPTIKNSPIQQLPIPSTIKRLLQKLNINTTDKLLVLLNLTIRSKKQNIIFRKVFKKTRIRLMLNAIELKLTKASTERNTSKVQTPFGFISESHKAVSIKQLSISQATKRLLLAADIYTLKDLSSLTQSQLFAIDGFGKKKFFTLLIKLRTELGTDQVTEKSSLKNLSVSSNNQTGETEKINEILSFLIKDLPISMATKKILIENNIITIKDLLSANKTELGAIKGFGQKKLETILNAVQENFPLISISSLVIASIGGNKNSVYGSSFVSPIPKKSLEPLTKDLTQIKEKLELLDPKTKNQANKNSPEPSLLMNLLIKDLQMPTSVKKLLIENDIVTATNLLNASKGELTRIKGFGQKKFEITLAAIKQQAPDAFLIESAEENSPIVSNRQQPKQEQINSSDSQNLLIKNLLISESIKKLLINTGIITVNDLLETNPKELNLIRGFGKKKLETVMAAVEKQFPNHNKNS